MKTLSKKLSMLGVVSAIGVSMAAQQAQAIPTLKLSDGTTTIEITDGGAFDTAAQMGIVSYIGAIGDFSFNMTTGFAKPFLSTAERPLMDIFSFNMSSIAEGGTLTIMFTETDFMPLDDGMRNYHFLSSIGGTTSGTVSYQTYLDESNTPYGMDLLLADLDGLTGSPSAFSDEGHLLFRPQNNYSLTMVVTVEHSATHPDYPMQHTSFDAELRGTPNPEPVTGALSFMGLGTLVAAMRRRRTV